MVPIRKPLERAIELTLVAATGVGGLGSEHDVPHGVMPDHAPHVEVYRPDTDPRVLIVHVLTPRMPGIAAVAVPSMAPGGREQLAGTLTLTETADARLAAGDVIRFSVADARLASAPIVTTNTGSGFLAELAAQDDSGFSVRVTNPSGGNQLGQMTIGSIEYDIDRDAMEGPVAVAIRASDWGGDVQNAIVEVEPRRR